MGGFVEALERRVHPRVRRQLPCRVLVAGHCRRGFVRDLSASGVCVEMQGALPLGVPAVVALDSPHEGSFVLEGWAHRSRQAAHSLALLAAAELVLRLQDPPPSYLRWLEGARGGSA